MEQKSKALCHYILQTSYVSLKVTKYHEEKKCVLLIWEDVLMQIIKEMSKHTRVRTLVSVLYVHLTTHRLEFFFPKTLPECPHFSTEPSVLLGPAKERGKASSPCAKASFTTK